MLSSINKVYEQEKDYAKDLHNLKVDGIDHGLTMCGVAHVESPRNALVKW